MAGNRSGVMSAGRAEDLQQQGSHAGCCERHVRRIGVSCYISLSGIDSRLQRSGYLARVVPEQQPLGWSENRGVQTLGRWLIVRTQGYSTTLLRLTFPTPEVTEADF
eukprot:jgi/Tetstr1/444633/TSEL_032481.t1